MFIFEQIYILYYHDNRRMKVLIVDDEELARNTLKNILENNHKDLKVVGEADSVNTALALIKSETPDLVFLDIDLKDGSGFDVLNSMNEINFKSIFVTAHHEYAIKAIKFSAFDYILKPVSELEIGAAIDKIKKQKLAEVNNYHMKALISNSDLTSTEGKKIILKTAESIHLVNINDIIRCEADNNYTTFYVNDNHKIVVSKGLKEYEELLSEFGFFRVHQSHLINLKEIKRYNKRDGGYLQLSDGSHIPVSQRKKQKLLELFELL